MSVHVDASDSLDARKRFHDIAEDARKAAAKQGGATVEDVMKLAERIAEASKLLAVPHPSQRLDVGALLRPSDPRTDARLYNLVLRTPHEAGNAGSMGQLQDDLQRVNDELLIADLLMCGSSNQTRYASRGPQPADRMPSLRLWRRWEMLTNDCKRALGESSATAGADWVPTDMSARIVMNIAADLRVAALFPMVDMPSHVFDLPVLGSDITPFCVPEAGIITASDPVTNKATMTAVKMAARIIATSELDEDAAVGASRSITSLASLALAQGIEDAIINGDTAIDAAGAKDVDMASNAYAVVTNIDGTTAFTTGGNFLTNKVKAGDIITGIGVTPPTTVVSIGSATAGVASATLGTIAATPTLTFTRPTHPYHRWLAWDGLRKKSLVSNMPGGDLSTTNAANILAIFKAMGVYGAIPSQGAIIVGVKGAAAIMPVVGFRTMDALGSLGSPLPGQIGDFLGRPVILTDYMREDLGVSGFVDALAASTNIYTAMLMVNRQAFALGRRRAVTINRSAQFSSDTDRVSFTGTWRGHFQELFPTANAANKSVGIGYKIS